MVEYCAKNISYQILPSENLIFLKAIKLKKKKPIDNKAFIYSLLSVNAYWGTTVLYM